jgi:hypothetical protein
MKYRFFRHCTYLILTYFIFSIWLISDGTPQSIPYPDQQFIIETGDSLFQQAELISNVVKSDDGKSIRLADGFTTGYLILNPQSSPYPFNIGLPSWNGTAPGDSGGFRVLIRVPYLSGWSPWLDVGYWKANLWPSKNTSFGGGIIDIDIVELNYYTSQWQYAIELKRNAAAVTSPTVSLLSFFISDSRTTQTINYTSILNDKPEPIFIPTTFLAQYRLSNEIGGSICSPTTVSMILLSYNIEVDPLQFALDTYDPYWNIFGVWPRVVQNASEYGVKGSVTRYRTWSEAREVLAQGGRIGMSIGAPLYGGHLVMLAGFTENGDPIVHDPARTYDGYAHVFNKYDLSRSWFAKGGVAYTIFPKDTSAVSPVIFAERQESPRNLSFELYPNYPNPFNSSTTFRYELHRDGLVEFYIYNLLGELVNTLVYENQFAGIHQIRWDGRDFFGNPVASGEYLYQIRFDHDEIKLGKLFIIK